MGKYQILRRDPHWVVMDGVRCVYVADNKAECLAWIEENKV